MKASTLIEIAANKGYSVAKVKSGIYQYSTNGFEWNNISCSWNEFCKLIVSL
jgi:hypothetical protein